MILKLRGVMMMSSRSRIQKSSRFHRKFQRFINLSTNRFIQIKIVKIEMPMVKTGTIINSFRGILDRATKREN